MWTNIFVLFEVVLDWLLLKIMWVRGGRGDLILGGPMSFFFIYSQGNFKKILGAPEGAK